MIKKNIEEIGWTRLIRIVPFVRCGRLCVALYISFKFNIIKMPTDDKHENERYTYIHIHID